jgi:hypothetical protein
LPIVSEVTVTAVVLSEQIPGGVRRTDSRASARVSVIVRTLRDTMNGLVLDVSKSGARLFLDGASDCHGDVMLHWLGHDVCAKVRWSRLYEVGVEFTRLLDDDALAEISAAMGHGAPTPAVEHHDPADPDPSPPQARAPAALTVNSIKRRSRS